MKRFITLSFALHILAMLLLIHSQSTIPTKQVSKPKNGQGQGSEQGDKQTNKTIIEVDIFSQAPNSKSCPNSYGGIGIIIRHEYPYVLITNLPANYPAHKAGLRIGDRVRPLSDIDIAGEAGTTITLEVLRDGKIFQKTITRAKICTEE